MESKKILNGAPCRSQPRIHRVWQFYFSKIYLKVKYSKLKQNFFYEINWKSLKIKYVVTVYARNQLFKVNNKKNDAKRISGADMFSNWKLIQGLHSDIEQKILVIFF